MMVNDKGVYFPCMMALSSATCASNAATCTRAAPTRTNRPQPPNRYHPFVRQLDAGGLLTARTVRWSREVLTVRTATLGDMVV
jgi:hypothetical protein